MIFCVKCNRGGHTSADCKAEFCPGCNRCIQSTHNSRNGNLNNLRSHKRSCADCCYDSDYEEEPSCEICGHDGHMDEQCNALWCIQCNRKFQTAANNRRNNENMRTQHMKTHQVRTGQCPACGEKRFRGASGVALHFEGGHCSACRSKENAEAAVYQFVRIRMPNYINRAICDSTDYTHTINPNYVPPAAYECKYCARTFNRFASLTQHVEDKHERNAPQLPPTLLALAN